jgi:hypothetical protein
MHLAGCHGCGKVSLDLGSGLRRACEAVEEVSFRRVEDYVREHRTPTVAETAEATGVTVSHIWRWIRIGRLTTGPFSDAVLQSSLCDARIPSGSHCPGCSERLARELAPGSLPPPPRVYTWEHRN